MHDAAAAIATGRTAAADTGAEACTTVAADTAVSVEGISERARDGACDEADYAATATTPTATTPTVARSCAAADAALAATRPDDGSRRRRDVDCVGRHVDNRAAAATATTAATSTRAVAATATATTAARASDHQGHTPDDRIVGTLWRISAAGPSRAQ